MAAAPFDPETTYVALRAGRADAIPVTESFWPDLMSGRLDIGGRLVTAYRFEGDWTNWERHPAGEELVVMLEGAMDMIIEAEDGERRVSLAAGQAFLIPTGLWHRGVDCRAAKALFVTDGEGTEHRPAG